MVGSGGIKKKNQVLVVTFKSSFPEIFEVYYQHGEEIKMKAIKTFLIKTHTPLFFPLWRFTRVCLLNPVTWKVRQAIYKVQWLPPTSPCHCPEILRFWNTCPAARFNQSLVISVFEVLFVCFFYPNNLLTVKNAYLLPSQFSLWPLMSKRLLPMYGCFFKRPKFLQVQDHMEAISSKTDGTWILIFSRFVIHSCIYRHVLFPAEVSCSVGQAGTWAELPCFSAGLALSLCLWELVCWVLCAWNPKV